MKRVADYNRMSYASKLRAVAGREPPAPHTSTCDRCGVRFETAAGAAHRACCPGRRIVPR